MKSWLMKYQILPKKLNYFLQWECVDRVPYICYFKAASLLNPFHICCSMVIYTMLYNVLAKFMPTVPYLFTNYTFSSCAIFILRLYQHKKKTFKCSKHVYYSNPPI